MSKTKLVIKLNYGASASPEKSFPASHRKQEYDWNYNKIAFSLGIGLIILAITGFFIKSQNRGTLDSQTALMRPDQIPPFEDSQSPSPMINSPTSEIFLKENPPVVAEIHSGGVKPDTGLADAGASMHEAKFDQAVAAESEHIVRAHFAWGISHKESTGAIDSPAILQPGDSVTLYFFSELKQLNGQTVSHVWSHKGRVAHIRDFQIRKDRLRVFTSRQLNSGLLGEWKVAIRDSDANILGEYVLNVLSPAKPE